MKEKKILDLAAAHGLLLKEKMSFNEMGIDFKIAFAEDSNGQKWVLRIPRRENQAAQIKKEKTILELAGKYLSVSVPDWQVASPTLVAYPLLEYKPVLTFDAETYEVTWNIDQKNSNYNASLAQVLIDLHQIPVREVQTAGLKVHTPESTRQEIFERIERVKREIGIAAELENRWRKWLDDDHLWPNFTTFIHGDLYAGHVLADPQGNVKGLIDWSEGQVNDPTIDFSGHISAFGEESVKDLINHYRELGGRTWDMMYEQTLERNAAAPLAYAVFALDTQVEKHMDAVKAQLGLT